ncbi:MAG: HAD family hydrolase [Pseudomonadota bacterium]
MRIAVWSGPRNLSTALMYSFGNRPDMAAVDEPFYGAFLSHSGIDHPLSDVIRAEMECDAGQVPGQLRQFTAPHQYEKHMVHHMLPGFPLHWMTEVRNVFLIRHPARVLASYVEKRQSPTAADLGFTQIEALLARADDPVIIDSADILRAPRQMLAALCDALGLPFDEAMLSWPAGPKPFDGPWAPHWYDAVHRSTGFEGANRPLPDVPRAHAPIYLGALAQYERMKARALSPSQG